jgi:nucleotide-binding universal stress UspA family protein
MQTILVGYDESGPAKRALERGAELAERFGAQLVVTSVAPLLAGGPRSAGPVDPADPLQHHIDELKGAREYLEHRGLHAHYVPAVGEPEDAIVRVAEERGADMIVVGTREPGLLGRLLGQSVSQGVSLRAHCDVLIVHPGN